MELKDFIAETLVQIQQGVEDAISLRTGKLGVINPAFGVDANAFTKDHIQPVEFDVAITVSDKASGGGKAGLKIFSVELGANGAKEKENSTVSRIKFTIPIIPCGQVVMPETGKRPASRS